MVKFGKTEVINENKKEANSKTIDKKFGRRVPL